MVAIHRKFGVWIRDLFGEVSDSCKGLKWKKLALGKCSFCLNTSKFSKNYRLFMRKNQHTDNLVIGIDASNIRVGGGVTHLIELLNSSQPKKHGFSKVIIWAKQSTLDQIAEKDWLNKCHFPVFEKKLIARMLWQRFSLSKLATQAGCNILFVPGGSYAGGFTPFVTMSQNLLPFEYKEMRRYGLSLYTLKLLLLRHIQRQTFRNANGLIFLTRYAQNIVGRIVKLQSGKAIVIPHGVNSQFFNKFRFQKPLSFYSSDKPYRIIYISIIDMYKHQWSVAEAIAMLRRKGLPVELLLVGPAMLKAHKRLKKTLDRIDPTGHYIKYIGPIPYQELSSQYKKSDLCLFASSCENMPIILLEGMASGLPIVCSDRGPMPEILGDGGVYFNPERPSDIADAILMMINSPELRERLGKKSFEKAHNYSWKHCADKTFHFFRQIAVTDKL